MNSHSVAINEHRVSQGTESPHISSSSSADDPERLMLIWESKEEKMIQSWQRTCIETASAHKKKATSLKCAYNFLSIPIILLPLVVASFAAYITNPIVMASIMLVISCCNGLLVYFNLGRLVQQHSQFEAEYMELNVNIERTLCKPKRNRVSCEMYLERISGALVSLNKRAPNL